MQDALISLSVFRENILSLCPFCQNHYITPHNLLLHIGYSELNLCANGIDGEQVSTGVRLGWQEGLMGSPLLSSLLPTTYIPMGCCCNSIASKKFVSSDPWLNKTWGRTCFLSLAIHLHFGIAQNCLQLNYHKKWAPWSAWKDQMCKLGNFSVTSLENVTDIILISIILP